jgi:hypothetical protein
MIRDLLFALLAQREATTAHELAVEKMATAWETSGYKHSWYITFSS